MMSHVKIKLNKKNFDYANVNVDVNSSNAVVFKEKMVANKVKAWRYLERKKSAKTFETFLIFTTK